MAHENQMAVVFQ